MTAVRNRSSTAAMNVPIHHYNSPVGISRVEEDYASWGSMTEDTMLPTRDACTQLQRPFASTAELKTRQLLILNDQNTLNFWDSPLDDEKQLSHFLPTKFSDQSSFLKLLDLKFLDVWTDVKQTTLKNSVTLFLKEFGAVGKNLTAVTDAITVSARPFDKIIQELSRLSDNWDQNGALAPTENVISDIMTSLIGLSEIKIPPSSYVDQDGTVSLKWSGKKQIFSLTYNGDGCVIGTLSPFRSQYKPWKFNVSNERLISQKIENDLIKNLVK